jgi:hypothetical protein
MLGPDTRPVDQGFSRSAVDGDGLGFAVLGVVCFDNEPFY